MSTVATVGVHETVTVTQLQSSQDLSGHLSAVGGHSTTDLPGILQHHHGQQQQQQSLVVSTPVTTQNQVEGVGGGGVEEEQSDKGED